MASSNSGSIPNALGAIGPRLALFCLPLVAGWIALDLFTAKLPNSYSMKRDRLKAVSDQVDTLILGPSNAYYDIAPKELSGFAFNLGNDLQPLFYDDRLLSKVLPGLPKLKRVIIGIHYVSMFLQLHGASEELKYYYAQEWHLPPPRLIDRLDARMWSPVALRSPEFAMASLRSALGQYRAGHGFAPAPAVEIMDERGWWCPASERTKRADLSEAEAARSVFVHHRLMRWADEPRNFQALDHMLSLLQERNIEAVLVMTPVWPSYAAQMRKDLLQRTRADLSALAQKHHARVLDLLSMPGLKAEDFLDVQHLNQCGAVRFTRQLDAALNGSSPGDCSKDNPGPKFEREGN